jgi:probable phosphoglycerate mutase
VIYVIRHGQTDLNKVGSLQGRIGLPLNEIGIQQANILKKELEDIKFNYAFSSPQERAIQTAVIVSGINVKVDSRIDVFDLGEADGLKKENVKFYGGTPDPRIYDGVEKIEDFVKRVFSFMKELEEKYSDKDSNILITGHRCTTGCIGAYFKGIPKDGNFLKYSSNNGEYNVYKFEN